MIIYKLSTILLISSSFRIKVRLSSKQHSAKREVISSNFAPFRERKMLKSVGNLLFKRTLDYLPLKYSKLPRYRGFISELSHNFKHNLANPRCVHNVATDLKQYAFPQAENAYAYTILKSLSGVKLDKIRIVTENVISSNEEFESFLNRNWRVCNAQEVVNGFNYVLKFCIDNKINISDERFNNLVDGLIDNVEKLSIDGIESILRFLIDSPAPDGLTAHNYHDVWSALDDVCCWRIREWDLHTCLRIGELWYKLGLGRKGDFIYEFLEKFSKKPERFSQSELVHIFFFHNVCRKRSMNFAYENAIEQKVHLMNSDQMGIIAMGFFKTKTKIKSVKTLNAMIDCAIDNIETIHEITLTAILKILKMSDNPLTADKILNLLEVVTPQVNRLSNLSCLHIALLGTGLQIFHPKALTAVSEKLSRDLDDLDQIRLKDIERLLLALTMFDFKPEITQGDIYELLLKQLYNPVREPEKQSHPKCVLSALLYLSIRNIYPIDLINQVLDMQLIGKTYGSRFAEIPRELISLNYNITIERPDYKGNKLPQDLRRRCGKFIIEYLPDRKRKSMSLADRLIHDVLDVCAEFVGDREKVFIGHIFPHFIKADIILCYDNLEKRFVIPPLEQYHIGDIVHPVNLIRYKWFVVMPISVNRMIRYIHEPVGIMSQKQRQLRTIGYQPVLVLYNEFLPLDTDSRLDYLSSKLNKLLK